MGGLLSRDPTTDLYRLGVDFVGLAAQVVSHVDVRAVAQPVLRALAESCQETVDLVVMDAGQVINLDQYVPPARRVRNIGAVGLRASPHCAAAGKVLLAPLSAEELSRVVPAKLERFTPRTITDPQEFRQELARVREQGYAIAQEELEGWLNVVAAPLVDHTGRVIAAISIAGPAYRVSPELFPQLAIQLKDAAATISRSLGYVG